MGKVVKKKKVTSVKKKPATLSYSKKLLITMGVLSLTLFLFVYEAQRVQENRSKAATNCDVAATELQMTTEENNLLQLINQYRATKGAPAITVSTGLTQSAAWLSADMNAKKYLQHTDSLNRTLETRVTDCGYPAGNGVGENIALGTTVTAQQIFDLWKSSTEGHNEEMLNASHKVAGIAQSGMYWTIDFGNAPDSTVSPVSPSSGAQLTPSFFPLAPCPSCATPSTVVPSTAAPVGPTTAPIISTEPAPTETPDDPTVTDSPTQPGQTPGQPNGLLDIIKLILEFIIKFFEQLFGGGGRGR